MAQLLDKAGPKAQHLDTAWPKAKLLDRSGLKAHLLDIDGPMSSGFRLLSKFRQLRHDCLNC